MAYRERPQDSGHLEPTGSETVKIVDGQGQVSFFEIGISPPATLRRELEAAGAGNAGGATI